MSEIVSFNFGPARLHRGGDWYRFLSLQTFLGFDLVIKLIGPCTSHSVLREHVGILQTVPSFVTRIALFCR